MKVCTRNVVCSRNSFGVSGWLCGHVWGGVHQMKVRYEICVEDYVWVVNSWIGHAEGLKRN
jgi:hypothetical protein